MRNYKRIGLNWLWVLAAMATTLMPLMSHQESGCAPACQVIPEWLRRLLHFESINALLDLSPEVRIRLKFDEQSIWSLWAFLQVGAISFILMFERDDSREPTRGPAVFGVIAFFLGLAGAVAAGLNLTAHRVVAGLVLVILTAVDYNMLSSGAPNDARREKFSVILAGVDVPIIISMLLVNLHIGWTATNESAAFFNGATAFQLMLANFAIILLTLLVERRHSDDGSVRAFLRRQFWPAS